MSSIPWPFPSRRAARGLRELRSALRAGLTRRVRRWARRRQGADPCNTILGPGRVYILPTGVGVVYALMVFAMLLGSMNYNNNLSFGLTFLLASLGLIAMHACQRTLVGLEVRFAGADPVFAGQSARFEVAVTNRARSARYQIQLYSDADASAFAHLAPGESRVLTLEEPTARRGYVELPRFGIRTLFPFELFRAWAWLHMGPRALVYPAPCPDAPEPPPSQTSRGHRQHDASGEEDFAGLRRFNEGDSPRHIAWKAYARTGDLLSKRFSGADTSSQWLDFSQIDGADTETRLSMLTRWILDADRLQRDYGLRLPGAAYPPAHGDAHRHRCLEALALFDDRRPDADGEA